MIKVALLSTCVLISCNAWADSLNSFSFSETDKQEHMIVSFAIAQASTAVCLGAFNFKKPECIVMGSILALGAGFYKEKFMDSAVSRGDLIADAIGTSASAALFLTFGF